MIGYILIFVAVIAIFVLGYYSNYPKSKHPDKELEQEFKMMKEAMNHERSSDTKL